MTGPEHYLAPRNTPRVREHHHRSGARHARACRCYGPEQRLQKPCGNRCLAPSRWHQHHLTPPWSARAEAAGDDLRLDLGGAADHRLNAAEPPELTIAAESSALVFPPVKAGLHRVSASRGVRLARSRRRSRHGIVSPRGSSPVRGVALTTTPNQRPRISQPSIRTSSPANSSRHSCHRSS